MEAWVSKISPQIRRHYYRGFAKQAERLATLEREKNAYLDTLEVLAELDPEEDGIAAEVLELERAMESWRAALKQEGQ